MNYIGELAALATSFFFAMTALIFTQTGRMVGSQVTNRMRLTFALVYLVIINLIFARANKARRDFRCARRAGPGNRARPLEPGNVRRLFSLPGEGHPGRHFRLGLDGV
jgi:hypothetical protein